MGRIGVTKGEVEQAILILQAQGKPPTVDGIREILGTGSKTTLLNHLKKWKEKQPFSLVSLPEELVCIVTELWTRLHQHAEERIQTQEKEWENKLKHKEESYQHLHQEFRAYEERLQQALETCQQEYAAKEKWESKWRLEYEAHFQLQERYQSLLEKEENVKQENQRLYQLANRMQESLEHYQNALQQLQLEQTLATEKQQSLFQQEKLALQSQIKEGWEERHALQRQLEEIMIDFKCLQEKYYALVTLQEEQKKQIQQLSEENLLFKERMSHQQKLFAANEQELTQTRALLAKTQQETFVLKEKEKHLQEKVTYAQDKSEALQAEKLDLIQEKARLEEKLRQLEKLTAVV